MRGPVIRLARAALLVLAASAAACNLINNDGPPRGPEETCARACKTRASQCSDTQCWRGCNFVIDRLAQHEDETVLACVASATSTSASKPAACDDRTWSRCAVRLGPYADGGPPAPPPPSDDTGGDDLD